MFRVALGRLVDGAEHFVAAEGRDHPLYVPPVAEARDITVIAATLCSDRRLEPCIIAKLFDQGSGIGKCRAAMDERAFHG